MLEHDDDRSRTGGGLNRDDAVLGDLVAQYLDRLNAGESVRAREILEAHPLHGEAIIEELETFVDLASGEEEGAPVLGTLGDYTLRRQIGHGGMGVVYEAWQGSVERSVALKLLPTGWAADNKMFLRFMREAKAAAQLSHPNLVGVHGMGVEDHTPYYAMEYVEGETLAQVLKRLSKEKSDVQTPFGPKDQLDYFVRLARACADVADGVQHAHSKGVIHRDIKPSNLILDSRDRLRLLDFGLARLEGQDGLTLSGDLVGTPAYMSPEQARRGKIAIDHRTDVYSLGATLFEAVCGEPPFRSKNHADTLTQIVEREPPSPRRLNPRVPQDLETIVLKCLRKDPGDRYGTAEALAQDLRRFGRGDAIEARPPSRREKTERWLRAHRYAVFGTILLVLVSMVGLAVSNARITAKHQELLGERSARERALYLAHMRLAHDDWLLGQAARSAAFLERHRPHGDEKDHRGWEWYYLDGLHRTELDRLSGHSSSVNEIAFSRTGELLASASSDHSAKVWDLRTSQVVHEFRHEAPVCAVDWSPDERHVATGCADGLVRVWGRNGRQPIKGAGELPGRSREAGEEEEPGLVSSVAYRPDGAALASGFRRVTRRAGCVRVWTLTDEELHCDYTLTVPEAGVRSVAWSPDGSLLAAGVGRDTGGEVILWNTRTREKLDAFRTNDWTSVRSVVWNPQGTSLAAASKYEAITLIPSGTGNRRRVDAGHLARAVAWSPDGGLLASGGNDGTLTLQNVAQGESRRTLRGHAGWIQSVAWGSSDLLASAGSDGIIRVWDPAREQGVTTFPGNGFVDWHPSGRYLATQAASYGTALVLDAQTGEESRRLKSGEGDRFYLTDAAFDASGDRLATVSTDGLLQIWDWRNSRVLRSMSSPGRQWRVNWSPTGQAIAMTDAGVEKSIVWDARTGKHRRTFESYCCAWSPDGRFFAGGVPLQIWETETWTQLEVVPPIHLDSLAWEPKGDRLLGVCSEGGISSLVVLEFPDLRATFATEGDGGRIHSVPWTPDGDDVVSAGRIRDVSWVPGGNRFTTIGYGGGVALWSAGEAEQLLTLKDGQQVGLRVSCSPDGRRIAAADTLTVKVWSAPGYRSAVTPQAE